MHVLLLLPVGGSSAGVLRAGSSRHFLALRPPALVNRDYDPRVLVIVAVQATSSAAVGQSGKLVQLILPKQLPPSPDGSRWGET